jgi:hypothetical protein
MIEGKGLTGRGSAGKGQYRGSGPEGGDRDYSVYKRLLVQDRALSSVVFHLPRSHLPPIVAAHAFLVLLLKPSQKPVVSRTGTTREVPGAWPNLMLIGCCDQQSEHGYRVLRTSTVYRHVT